MARIWIDAGHGGNDPGAVAFGRTEKSDNLRFALKLSEILKQHHVETVLTREEDKDMTASQRAALEQNCDLAVSCHRNAGSETATGVEIWIHSNATQNIADWAANVIKNIEKTGMPIRQGQVSKGVYKGYPGYPNTNFWVNRNTKSPSMLLEMGFLTNKGDNAFFDLHIDDLAAAVAAGCLRELGVDVANIFPENTAANTEKLKNFLNELDGLIKKYETEV